MYLFIFNLLGTSLLLVGRVSFVIIGTDLMTLDLKERRGNRIGRKKGRKSNVSSGVTLRW